MDFNNILFSIENGIAIIKLNRPAALNALSRDLIKEMDQALDLAVKDEQVKVVIITGDKNFAAGADIKNMMNLNPEEARAFSFNDTFAKIENLPKPVIAVMYGYALGGGLELAMLCDFRIAEPKAKFGLPEINLGIFPGAGGTQRLPRLIGMTRAKEMIMTGIPIDAQKALEYGLINSIADDPMAEAIKLAQILMSKGAVALKLAKQCINISANVDVKSGLEFEANAWACLFATQDQKEGMLAFVEKRKPNFIGK